MRQCVRISNVYVYMSLFQDELDLSEEHRANMFALPAEKKWQIYCSKKMVPMSLSGRMIFLLNANNIQGFGGFFQGALKECLHFFLHK